MKKLYTLILIGGAGSLLSGCFIPASQQDVNELKAIVSQMQANQAELASKMDELNQNLAVSNENLEQTGGQISELSAKLDDISAGIRPATKPSDTAATAQPAALLPSDLFAECKNHLDKGAYDAAASGFKLYLAKYPQSEQADQAYMYLGDAYIAAGQTKKGAVAYATLLQQFPKSKLTASARLKYALSILPLGKTDEAKRYFASVVQDYPKSTEAVQAKAELAKLN